MPTLFTLENSLSVDYNNNNNNNNNNLFSFILHASRNYSYSVVNLVEKWNNYKAVCLFPVGIGFPMTSFTDAIVLGSYNVCVFFFLFNRDSYDFPQLR